MGRSKHPKDRANTSQYVRSPADARIGFGAVLRLKARPRIQEILHHLGRL